MASKQQYVATNLPENNTEQLLQLCYEVGCPVDLQDLEHPTPARMQGIYEWWLQTILKINIEDCKRAAEAQLDTMEYPEIHRDALYIGVFQLTLNQLLRAGLFEDFSMVDLVAPTPQRVNLILSCLVNYYNYDNELRQEHLIPIEKQDAELEALERDLASEIDDLKRKINQEREKRKKNESKAEECKVQIKEHTARFQERRAFSKVLEAKSVETQERCKSLQEAINALSSQVTTCELEIARLKRQIVQSPDRLRSSVFEMSRALQQDKESVTELEAKEILLQTKISSFEKYEGDIGSCLKIMGEWEIDAKKLSEAIARYQSHCDTYDSLTADHAELDNKITLLKRRVANARDEITRHEEKVLRKRNANKQKKKSLEDQHAQLVEEKKLIEMRAAAKNKEAAEVEHQIREIHASLYTELERSNNEYSAIRSQCIKYSDKMRKRLDGVNAACTKPLDLSL